MKKKIFLIAGARPNFMKIFPIWKELNKYPDIFEPKIVHTGQHYDKNMSDSFFQDFDLPRPDYFLGVGSGTHSEQTAKVMVEFEKIINCEQPEVVLVVGDVNSTLACSLVVSKTKYKNCLKLNPSTQLKKIFSRFKQYLHRPLLIHVEAGLRSFDYLMPEEINRIVTDDLADLLLTHSPEADDNLVKNGIEEYRIINIGNVMIDTLELMRAKIEMKNTINNFSLEAGNYGLITLHRPSNVDIKEKLEKILKTLHKISKKIKLCFPIHPRTLKNIKHFGLLSFLQNNENISISEPLNYINFLNLVTNAKMIITDSGGIQEESSYLNIPCLTLRENTERPITIMQGTNELVNIEQLEDKVELILKNSWKKTEKISGWDGYTSRRIVKILRQLF